MSRTIREATERRNAAQRRLNTSLKLRSRTMWTDIIADYDDEIDELLEAQDAHREAARKLVLANALSH